MVGHERGIVDGYSTLLMYREWRLLQHGRIEWSSLFMNLKYPEPWTLNPEPWTLNPERGSCNKVGSLKRISVLLTPLSNVGVVDLEVCCSILGTFHSAPRYFNFIDRSELSVGRVPHSMMLEMLEIFWNGYHLLLQPLTDKVNYLWIQTAVNPLGIDITLYNSFWR